MVCAKTKSGETIENWVNQALPPWCIAAIHVDFIAGGGDSDPKAVDALRGFVAGADLVVVQVVLFAYRYGRKVRHHDVGTGQQPFFAAGFVDSAQGCGGG